MDKFMCIHKCALTHKYCRYQTGRRSFPTHLSALKLVPVCQHFDPPPWCLHCPHSKHTVNTLDNACSVKTASLDWSEKSCTTTILPKQSGQRFTVVFIYKEHSVFNSRSTMDLVQLNKLHKFLLWQ